MNGCLQLQDIEDLGLMVYYYNPKYFYDNANKQNEMLIKDLKDWNLIFRYDEDIDKLKSIMNKKIYFSEKTR